MSKEIAKTEETPLAIMAPESKQAIAYLSEAAGPQGLSIADLDRITVPAGGSVAWEIPSLDGTESAKAFEAIILEQHDVRRYYAVGLEQSEGSAPPDCWSLDMQQGEGTPGGACLHCPLAQFGSDARGVGQACKAYKSLFLLRPDEIKPLILSIPPTSLKFARKYLLNLASRAISFAHVVTEFSLVKTKSGSGISYGQVAFRMARRLTDTEQKAIAAVRETLVPRQSHTNVE